MLVLNSNMENGTLTVSLRIEPGEFMDALNEAYAEPHGYISCAPAMPRDSPRAKRLKNSTERQRSSTKPWTFACPGSMPGISRKTPSALLAVRSSQR